MKTQIEMPIPEGYRLSPESTKERVVLELEEKNTEDKVKDFLFNIFNKMKVRIEPDEPGHVYYDIDNITMFEQDFKNGILWVSYSQIWGVFKTKFQMDYSEIQKLIKNIVEETLNWKGLTPLCLLFFTRNRVEDVLHWKGLTPEHADNVV